MSDALKRAQRYRYLAMECWRLAKSAVAGTVAMTAQNSPRLVSVAKCMDFPNDGSVMAMNWA
jgi:hypothetical protein